MKTSVLLTILAAGALLSGCSKEESVSLSVGDGSAIRLGAGVSMLSKAPLESGANFVASVAGWESSSAVDYSAAQTWRTTTSEITVGPVSQNVALREDQVYNVDGNVKTYMKSWYPEGMLNNGMVSFVGDPKYAGDGSDDVLLAGEISGSKSDRDNKVLVFNHMTTQLKFVVKAGTGLAEDTKLTRIELKNVDVPAGINLVSDALLSTSKNALPVPGIDGSLVIGTSAGGDAVGTPLMIVPPSGNTVSLKVTTSVAEFDNVVATISEDASFQSGKSYTITLTFGQKNILLSATVSEWTEGSGSGLVE